MSAKRFAADEIEAFCQHYARHGNQSAAVRHAFVEARTWKSNDCWKRAYKIMQRQSVRRRIAELKGGTAEIAQAPLAAPECRAALVAVRLNLEDVQILARGAAAAEVSAELRLVCSRIVAQAVANVMIERD